MVERLAIVLAGFRWDGFEIDRSYRPKLFVALRVYPT